jgi:transcriptional regulator GlxA family with amidase domain
MARATATSTRTLARRLEKALGTTPQRFAQRLRIARAVQLLETTQESVDEIAARVGYADPAAFRRIFRRESGESPRERRARSRHAG